MSSRGVKRRGNLLVLRLFSYILPGDCHGPTALAMTDHFVQQYAEPSPDVIARSEATRRSPGTSFVFAHSTRRLHHRHSLRSPRPGGLAMTGGRFLRIRRGAAVNSVQPAERSMPVPYSSEKSFLVNHPTHQPPSSLNVCRYALAFSTKHPNCTCVFIRSSPVNPQFS